MRHVILSNNILQLQEPPQKNQFSHFHYEFLFSLTIYLGTMLGPDRQVLDSSFIYSSNYLLQHCLLSKG